MKKDRVRQLKIGIYQIYWKSGGSSIAAIGCTESGNKWMAPLNWVHPSEDEKMWRAVERVELILIPNY